MAIFFDGKIKSNYLCTSGDGDPVELHPRAARGRLSMKSAGWTNSIFFIGGLVIDDGGGRVCHRPGCTPAIRLLGISAWATPPGTLNASTGGCGRHAIRTVRPRVVWNSGYPPVFRQIHYF